MTEGNGKRGSKRRRRQQTIVVCSTGSRQPFLRGMLTHDLMQRGFGFDDAYAVARTIRDRVHDRDEVTTSELRDLVERQLEKTFGGSVAAPPPAAARAVSPIRVLYRGEQQPFSRGLLARSVHAAGVDLDRSYRVVTDLEARLSQDGVELLPSSDIARYIDALLEEHEGKETARRYRLIRRIHRLPRPLAIYISGASGTGKSSLALELAPLLRIYRVIATDTIRQVMRMVFTPAILPALHRSSFELPVGEEEAGEDDPRPRDRQRRLVANFEEQAVRVAVGVRAVVERSIAENRSIVVEGVHVHSGLVPFRDLDPSAYQVAMVLATMDEETHRARFLRRSFRERREADHYLENFDAIRSLHGRMLELAEQHDVPVLDTSDAEATISNALQLVTGVLESRLSSHTGGHGSEPAPVLLLYVDGLADRVVPSLGGKTPLAAADLPTLDRLAKEGKTGIADPVGPGVVGDTVAGCLALFAQSPKAIRRGPVEAAGAGIELGRHDVALRGNLATLDDNGLLVDRRADRIRAGAVELAKAIDRLPLGEEFESVTVRVKPATEHRLAVVLRGEGLSPAIRGSDPGDGARAGAPLVPHPVHSDDTRADFTARALAAFEQEARRVLAEHPVNRARLEAGRPPANAVITRSAGRSHRLVPLERDGQPLTTACVGGDRTVLGLARCLGARTIRTPAMTANLDTDVGAKFEAAGEALADCDLVMIHFKGTDIASHDRRPDLKVGFLERIDQELGAFLKAHDGPLRVAVASDHATLSEAGQHAADPVPVLIWGPGIEPDDSQVFDEAHSAAGALGRVPLQMLLSFLFDLS